jgi:hypothetical protein
MKKKSLAVIMVALVAVGFAAWLVQDQLSVVQARADELEVLNRYFEGENRDLQDEKRSLLFDLMTLAPAELLKQLGDLTEQLALERVLNVKILSLSHEDHWSDYGPYLGRSRARMVFNVTVRSDDVVALSGLKLTVRTFSGSQEVGWISTTGRLSSARGSAGIQGES